METHNVEITRLYKNNILQEVRKKHKPYNRYTTMLVLLLLPVFAMVCLRLCANTELKEVYMNVCNIYNPIYSPYSETGSITFAWNYVFDNEIEELNLPIISSNITIDNNGTIIAEVKESILVKSVADGVVDNIYDADGVNVVRIVHGNNLSVEYIGLDVLGVQVGNMVYAGKEIGTARLGDNILLKV